MVASHVGGFPTRNSGTGESNELRVKREKDCRGSLKLKDLSNMRGFVSHMRVINQMYLLHGCHLPNQNGLSSVIEYDEE